MSNAEQKLKEWYAEDRGRRVSAGMREKAERGTMPGCAPIGYVNAVVDGEKVIVPDPETAPLVREAFELVASGMSVRKTLLILTEKGLRSRNGKPIGASGLWNILVNPFYAGQLRYGGIIKHTRHQSLIELSAFQEAQAVLSLKRQESARCS